MFRSPTTWALPLWKLTYPLKIDGWLNLDFLQTSTVWGKTFPQTRPTPRWCSLAQLWRVFVFDRPFLWSMDLLLGFVARKPQRLERVAHKMEFVLCSLNLWKKMPCLYRKKKHMSLTLKSEVGLLTEPISKEHHQVQHTKLIRSFWKNQVQNFTLTDDLRKCGLNWTTAKTTPR